MNLTKKKHKKILRVTAGLTFLGRYLGKQAYHIVHDSRYNSRYRNG